MQAFFSFNLGFKLDTESGGFVSWNGKWRFSDGSAVFWAAMEDEAFNRKVEKGEVSFTNGDMLRVKLRIRQFVKDGKLASEYMVIKVLEQRKAPKQIKLDFPYRIDDNETKK